MYCAPFSGEIAGYVVENLKKFCPGHQPLLTGVGVAGLYEGMRIEIEVVAHVGGV